MEVKGQDTLQQRSCFLTPDIFDTLSGHDFSETIKPLLLELNSIKTLGEKIKSSPDVQRVARQTAETLAAATAMEKTVGDSQRVTDSAC